MMGPTQRTSASKSPRTRTRTGPPKAPTPTDLATHMAADLRKMLPSRRWFGSKTRTITRVAPLDWAAVPGTSGLLALFEVTYADGGREIYQVPVIPTHEAGAIGDATEDPTFCRLLIDQIRLASSRAGRAGLFRFTPTPALAEVLPDAPVQVTQIAVEQSNTSVAYDDRATLKLFRKVEPGPNPDFEIVDFLSRRTSFREVPRLLGVVTYEGEGEDATTLAVLQEFVPNQGDAWAGAQARLAEYFTAAAECLDPEGSGNEAFARTLADADAEEARRLGALTGRLHVALASATEPALAPETITPTDIAAWHDGMQGNLDRAIQTLASVHERLPAAVRDLAHQVLEAAPHLRQSLAALDALGAGSVTKIRLHGDYHLGQLLKANTGFVILDFEGEPARPLAERRAKHCALRDVAGMLRSFAYAVRIGLAAPALEAPDERGRVDRLAAWAERWESGARAAFLEGYLAETWERGAAFLPSDRDDLDAALRVFELDKALYELHYELNHRPAWVRVPLEGLRRTLTAAPRPVRERPRPGGGPFGFVACLELREFLGLRAENERRLADLIDEVPLDSIYYHTHGFFLRHKFVAGAYPNDFATWAAVQVRDPVLGERLAMVDPSEFTNLHDLREELVSVIDDHLRGLQMVPGVILGEPFEFIQSRIVEIPMGIEVRTLQEFRDALLTVDVSAIFFHLIEARLRLGRGQNDFAAWVEHGLDLPELAAALRAVDPYAGSLERARSRIIQICDETLAEGVRR
jgi:trehalose synthase-fused probable maltokinase